MEPAFEFCGRRFTSARLTPEAFNQAKKAGLTFADVRKEYENLYGEQIDTAPEPTEQDLSMERWFRVDAPVRDVHPDYPVPHGAEKGLFTYPMLVKVEAPGEQCDVCSGAYYPLTRDTQIILWGEPRNVGVCSHQGEFVEIP